MPPTWTRSCARPARCWPASACCPCRSRCSARPGRRRAAAGGRQPPVRARPVRGLRARRRGRGDRGGEHRGGVPRPRAHPAIGALAPVDRRGGLRPARRARGRSRTRRRRSTRFVLLRGACPPPTGRDRSFFVVTPRRDEPGSLVRLLQEFSVRGINLTTIESRPTRALLGEYRFLIECEGHVADAHVRDAVLGLLRFPGEIALPRLVPGGPGAPRPPARAVRERGRRARLRADAGAGRAVSTGVVGLGLIGGSILRGLGGASATTPTPACARPPAPTASPWSPRLSGLAGCDLVIVAVPPGPHPRGRARRARRRPGRGRRRHRLGQGAGPERARRGRALRRRPPAGGRRDVRAGRRRRRRWWRGAVWAVCPAGRLARAACAGCRTPSTRLGGRLLACTRRRARRRGGAHEPPAARRRRGARASSPASRCGPRCRAPRCAT